MMPTDWSYVSQDVEKPETLDDSGSGAIRIGVIALLLFFVGLGGWAALTRLDAGVVADGVVTVASHRQSVQHPEGGVITKLAVREGLHVRAGQILIELDRRDLAATELSLTSELIAGEALAARLHAEIMKQPTITRPASWANLPPRYVGIANEALAQQIRERAVRQRALGADVSVLSEQRSQYRQRVDALTAQIRSTDDQIRSVQDELTGLSPLAERGFVSGSRIRQLERVKLSLEQQRTQLASARTDASSQTSATGLQASSVESSSYRDIAEQLRQIDTLVAELRPRALAASERLSKASIRAPVAGTVVGLSTFTVGGVVAPGERIMDIVPADQRLVLDIQFDPRDADDVNVGMPAEIRFLASSSRTLPIFQGTVSRLSADRLVDPETRRPFFRGEVIIPAEEVARLKKLGGGRLLSVGLPVQVVILMRKRTALQYLLEPLSQRLWGALREH